MEEEAESGSQELDVVDWQGGASGGGEGGSWLSSQGGKAGSGMVILRYVVAGAVLRASTVSKGGETG